MTKIIICKLCGFINDEEMIDDEYNCQCPCCGLYDIEIAEN